LPLRLCELGTVYRYEKAGVLHGLLRVRGFTQDDAHIFCQPHQLNEEILKIIDLALFMLNTFGFKEFEIDLSLRDPKNKSKYLGKDDVWIKAEEALIYALDQKGLKYQKAFGEAVFYGPKIDIKIKDSLGRLWQCSTIQVDFNFPEKFNLSYINDKNQKIQPIMIHRTILGAMERFMGCLIEYYEGAFPVWLSPEQIWIIPIGITHKEYAQETFNKLLKENFRCQLKDENETVSKKIREGEIQKIPYLVIIGDKEINEETISIRQRDSGDLGPIKLNNFIKKIKQEIEERTK
jgi:threonyl-tRNA synthetase